MKKSILILLAVFAVVITAVSTSEAWIYDASYLNGDDQVIFSDSSWDWWNHLVITYNNQDLSASATVLDPYGNPSNDYGYFYFWADFFSSYFDFYGSNNGVTWYFIARYFY